MSLPPRLRTSAAPARRGAIEHDDELDPDELGLPPLDAGEDDDPGDDLGEIEGLLDEGESSLDDANAEGLDIGLDLDEPGADGGDDDEAELDVGPLDEGLAIDDERSAGDDPAEDAGDDHDEAEFDDAASSDDGGAEGTGEAVEDEVDERALPELDADESGSDDESALAEELLAQAGADLPPWARVRWGVLEGAGAPVPSSALAALSGRVAAAGEVLLLVEEGARSARRLPFDAVAAVALGDDSLLAATARGQLLYSDAGGREARVIAGWRAGAGPVELAATPGRFWVRAGASLHSVASPDAPASVVLERGVLAVAASGGTLFALTDTGGPPAIQRLRGDDEGWRAEPLHGEARRIAEAARSGARVLLAAAAGGRLLGLSDGQRVAVSRDGGATFEPLDLGPTEALAFAGDDDDAPLVTLHPPRGSALSHYVAEVPAAGSPARLAELPSPAEPEAAGAAALAWDPSRDALWVACRAGLFALARARRH